ncbi:Bax inhibitor-1 family protein [Sulfobacillus thermosulfidooxidans]|uniref:Bax inhibitor-1 family protein n=1 Tax=Sulfobacillus thermosulfidooxidans TaxID=28034 RepID=UPI0006B5CBAD|nr:Bax inhibitor-1 family protein [Sulfobacillus thermosulfidooxidans]
MYNRTPYTYSVADGIKGSLMARTLGYLALLLVVLMLASLFGVSLGSLGIWMGFIAAMVGTIFVSRNQANAGAALFWGIVVAAGLGIAIAPILWYAILYQNHLFITTLGAILVAMLLSAAIVSWIPWDFSKLAPILFLGLLMLIITSLLSFFLPSMFGVVASRAYNLIGVVIFTGYLLLDFSIMRYRGRALPTNGTAIVLAVSLLVDIINLFLFLLRLGRR